MSRLVVCFLALFLPLSLNAAESFRDWWEKHPQSRLFVVVFGLKVNQKGELTQFEVSGITEPKVHLKDKVELDLPQGYLDIAKQWIKEHGYPPRIEDGKVLEFFVYSYFCSDFPDVLIDDLDAPIDVLRKKSDKLRDRISSDQEPVERPPGV